MREFRKADLCGGASYVRLDPTECSLQSKEVMQYLLENTMFAIAKITTKGQTTIPQAVRAAMLVTAGDLIAWEVGPDGTATVRRIQPLDLDYLRAVEGTLSEWAGSADEEAYREL